MTLTRCDVKKDERQTVTKHMRKANRDLKKAQKPKKSDKELARPSVTMGRGMFRRGMSALAHEQAGYLRIFWVYEGCLSLQE